jgi:putative FmdB family regulatory protein
MPIYEYRCNDCGSVTEILEGVGGVSERPHCESCDSTDVARMFSSFAPVMAGGSVTEGSCCGLTDPCDNPKRCCTR